MLGKKPLLAGEIRSCFGMTELGVVHATQQATMPAAPAMSGLSTVANGGLQALVTHAVKSGFSWV
jgi:hypothetical protein